MLNRRMKFQRLLKVTKKQRQTKLNQIVRKMNLQKNQKQMTNVLLEERGKRMIQLLVSPLRKGRTVWKQRQMVSYSMFNF